MIDESEAVGRSAEPCCTPLARTPLSAEGAASLAGLLKALADPTRLRLHSLIQSTRAERPACAS